MSDQHSEDPGSNPSGAVLCFFFSFDPAVSSSIFVGEKKERICLSVCLHVQPGAVKSVFCGHCMHLSYMHTVTSEDQFHCTRLYV